MAVYCTLADAIDEVLEIEERHLLKADVYLDSELINHGFSPADLTLPIPVLTEIASLMALRYAAIEQAIGENSPLLTKAKQYQTLIDELLGALVLNGLGVVGGSRSMRIRLI